jgi:hypothetical protein
MSNDPNVRRRLDREAMNVRDRAAWRLQRDGWSVRAIGRELGIPASSVQRCLERMVKRVRQRELELETVAAGDDEPLYAEDVTRAEQVGLLDELERWRLGHAAPGSVARAALDEWLAGHPVAWSPPTVYPISGGHCWRDGVQAALASNAVDGDDDW